MLSVLRALKKRLDARIKSVEEALGSGAAQNFDQYAKMVGEVKGLRYAKDEIDAMAKNLNEDGDDDDEESR